MLGALTELPAAKTRFAGALRRLRYASLWAWLELLKLPIIMAQKSFSM